MLIGMDIGGTNSKVAIFDSSGKILTKNIFKTNIPE